MTTFDLIFTICNEVVKVMFLHLSVCPQGGVPVQVPPCYQLHPRDQVHPPGTRYTPPQDQVHPPGQVLPWTRCIPPRPGTKGPSTPPHDQVHPQPEASYTPLGPGTPPRTRYTPQPYTPPRPGTPPGTRYTPSRRLLLRTACIRKAT